LTSLTFCDFFDQQVDNLPCGFLPQGKFTQWVFTAREIYPVGFYRKGNLPSGFFNLPSGFFNLPKTLKSITFGESFNKSVDNLPETLTSITFGKMFNRKLNL
jgi:hypothetical protein